MPIPEPKLIRFIDSNYTNLFFLPDGANIRLTYTNGERRILPCKYMDEYHLKAGKEVFHICQFAEIMERNGATCAPEKPSPRGKKRTTPKKERGDAR